MKFKIFLAALIAATVTSTLLAGGERTNDPVELKKRFDKKLASEFLKDKFWTTDFKDALARSADKGKPVLIYFTRSSAT
jgi:hypothetical protein